MDKDLPALSLCEKADTRVRNLLAKIQIYLKVNRIKPKSINIPNLTSGFTNRCSQSEI